MNFRVFALIVAVPLLTHPAQAQDPQAPSSSAKVTSTKVASTKASQGQAPQVQQAEVSQTETPSFRKGLWRFIRTLDVVRNANKNIKYRVVDREMTRCVDPTHAMKTTFSSAPVGSCVS